MINVVIFIFFFSVRPSLKIENKINNITCKTETTEAPYMGPESLKCGLLELSLTGTSFHCLKPVRATGIIVIQDRATS